jgi:uncharacterized repeat protein (TIGR03847 family)
MRAIPLSDGYDYDLDPVSFITVGAVGPPGQRTFYLQASQSRTTVSLLIEKEHAAALALSIERLLAGLAEQDPASAAAAAERLEVNMDLLTPVTPVFRVGQLGIGVDAERDLVVLVAEEQTEDETEDGRKVRLVGSYDQMLTLSRHALDVVNQGRPTCVLCGEPIDAEGHFCARRNGHPNSLTV